MTDMVAVAERIAKAAHAGKRDLAGPYENHLARVVALVGNDDDDAVMTAWLHDILEDTPTTSLELLAAGIPEAVVDAVRILTRHPKVSYTDYIRSVQAEKNWLALRVKIADLKDHLRDDPSRVLRPESIQKYKRALRLLTAG